MNTNTSGIALESVMKKPATVPGLRHDSSAAGKTKVNDPAGIFREGRPPQLRCHPSLTPEGHPCSTPALAHPLLFAGVIRKKYLPTRIG